MDDCTLITRMADGDQSAAGEIYDRYGRQVYALAYRMLQDGAAAEAMTQEVFVRLWRNAARFDPVRDRAATWVLHTAHTTAVDLIRARGYATPGRYADDSDEPAATAAPAAGAELAVMGAQVRSSLMRLPPEQRHTLEMSYFDALSPSEIAGRLGIPLGTVRSRLRLGLDTLRQAFISPRSKEVDKHVTLPPC